MLWTDGIDDDTAVTQTWCGIKQMCGWPSTPDARRDWQTTCCCWCPFGHAWVVLSELVGLNYIANGDCLDHLGVRMGSARRKPETGTPSVTRHDQASHPCLTPALIPGENVTNARACRKVHSDDVILHMITCQTGNRTCCPRTLTVPTATGRSELSASGRRSSLG